MEIDKLDPNMIFKALKIEEHKGKKEKVIDRVENPKIKKELIEYLKIGDKS